MECVEEAEEDSIKVTGDPNQIIFLIESTTLNIFNELGLTDNERKEVYWSVCELVKQRLDKARSLKK